MYTVGFEPTTFRLVEGYVIPEPQTMIMMRSHLKEKFIIRFITFQLITIFYSDSIFIKLGDIVHHINRES